MSALFEAPGQSIPEQLGKHRIVGKLATGGMATVYLARLVGPSGFENLVVIKRMLPHLAEDPRFREMFADEARTVAKLRHPNVVRTFELVDEGDEIYLVMEYLEGETLQRLARTLAIEKKALPRGLVCHIVAEAAAGLHAAHELTDEDGSNLGVVHRDVSPHNLFIGIDGSVKVIDFGIAKSLDRANQTTTGEIKGKFAYMSPEQASAQATTRRTDVFALGVVLWELLTWRRLFARENQMVTLRAVADEVTPPPSSIVPGISPALDAICARCLAKDPAERYATMAELRRDLLAAQRSEGDGDPQTEIAEIMRALFEKSIAQRKAMVRASRTEATKSERILPRSSEPKSIDVTIEEPLTEVSVSAVAKPPSRMRWGIAGVVGLVAVLAIGVGFAYSSSPSTPAPPTSVAVAPPPTSAPVAPPPSTTVAPSRAHVTIESDPVGALVVVDGIARGNTPLSLELPMGDAPLSLELSLAGRRGTTTRFVPDHDQTLRITMPRTGGARASGDAPPGGGDEHRGFFAFE